MKKNLIYSIIFILILIQVKAHGNILYDINLDFDKELKSKISESAQSYLNLNEEPIQFDFDRELIVVRFDRAIEYSVNINPIDYSVFGFRDDSLFMKKDVKFDQKARKNIAQKIFDKIPEKYKDELVYGEERKGYAGNTFKHTWYRKVDNIVVLNDHLEVEVNGNGEVVTWRLSPFFYSKEQMKTTPAITHEVAQKISEIRFNGEPLEFKPILIIENDKLVWISKVKSLYPIFVGVDALTGDVLSSGRIRGEVPEDYDYGREVEVVETNFIKNIYEGEK